MLIDKVVDRIKREYSLKEDKEVAELIGISPQNFSKKKAKGTIISDLFEWSIINGKDLNLLFKGEKREVRMEAEEKRNENNYLTMINEWISKKLNEDPRTAVWFEVEFERAFDEFKIWKEEKEAAAIEKGYASNRKVA